MAGCRSQIASRHDLAEFGQGNSRGKLAEFSRWRGLDVFDRTVALREIRSVVSAARGLRGFDLSARTRPTL
jgi:hypothetical protein